MTLLENIKAAISQQQPVVAMINGKASVFVGYDDDKQQFLVRPCGGEKEWVPYSKLEGEAFKINDNGVANDIGERH